MWSNIMKIAIVGSFSFHLECIGFLLEIYNNNNNNIDIYLCKNSDPYNYIKYYLTRFNFNIIYRKKDKFKDKFNEDIINNYDKIFKLSSNDKCLDNKKIISILHLKRLLKNCKSKNFISLTPFIQGTSIYIIFPIFSPKVTCSKNSNIVIMIGNYTIDSFDTDTINFIKSNINYHFIFIISGSTHYPNLKNLDNVSFFSKVETIRMYELINNSKFILSKKKINYDRFSGQLALAISFEKPLILDIKTKNTYELPGIPFDRKYSEVGKLDDITDEEYNVLKKEIKIFKNNTIQTNKQILSTIS